VFGETGDGEIEFHEASDLASQVRAEVAALDASLPALEVIPVERVLSQLLATRRFEIWALGAFGLCGLLLAGAGRLRRVKPTPINPPGEAEG
jgi:hypothetical protein